MYAHKTTKEHMDKIAKIAKESKQRRVSEAVALLTEEEKQLLKDTINCGKWGDTDMSFRTKDGEEEVMSCGYCTNDAKKAGHFSGRKISAIFRSIYSKVCPQDGIGEYITQISDWWGGGHGDMLFIRSPFYKEFEEWARA